MSCVIKLVLSLPFSPSQAVIGRHSVPASVMRKKIKVTGHVRKPNYLINTDQPKRSELSVPVWPSLVVASSLPAPGLCRVTGPSTSRSQLRSARRAEGREEQSNQTTKGTLKYGHFSTKTGKDQKCSVNIL